ncbi:MAG: ROK family protein [Balneolales bacterium]
MNGGSINTFLVIGIDGGGTKTIGRLTDSRGSILAEHHEGPSNYQVCGADACAETLYQLINILCDQAKQKPSDIRSIVIGLAGAGRQKERDTIFCLLDKKLNSVIKLNIVSDADIALDAEYGEEPGVIIIAGTGSIIFGRNPDGKNIRAGGWGPIIGDPGSGHDIGLKALQKISRIFDGLDEKSELLDRCAESGIETPETFIKAVYQDMMVPSKLTYPVFEAARNNDKNALNILNQAAEGLTNLLAGYLNGFSHMQEIPITLKGGMLENDTIYRRILLRKMEELPYHFKINEFINNSIDGAINMALRNA